LKATTLTIPRPRASRGTTYWRTMHSIFVRNAAGVVTWRTSCLSCMAKTRTEPGRGS
jgi:hypothetical protein